jgi:hypothetical protein
LRHGGVQLSNLIESKGIKKEIRLNAFGMITSAICRPAFGLIGGRPEAEPKGSESARYALMTAVKKARNRP